MTTNLTAEQHKLKGNDYFKLQSYDDAIQEYSTAIVKDPKVAVYYSNRANCYLKLERYINVVADCERVIELDPKSVKGHYIMGKAQLELAQPSEALSFLKKAYELALDQRSTFVKDIVFIISEAKKQKWIEEERRRISQSSDTYRYMTGLVEQDIQRQIQALDPMDPSYEDAMSDQRSERAYRLHQLDTMFQRASHPDSNAQPYLSHAKVCSQSPQSPHSAPHPAMKENPGMNMLSLAPREVPDYLLDKITFEIMHDPVVSIRSGISYERSTLLEHFSYGRMFDPVAQMPMTERDIVPNRALKEACDEFLSKNGWAVGH